MYHQVEEALRVQGFNTLRYVVGGFLVFFIGSWFFGGEIKEEGAKHTADVAKQVLDDTELQEQAQRVAKVLINEVTRRLCSPTADDIEEVEPSAHPPLLGRC